MPAPLTPDAHTFRALVADVAARAKARLPEAVNGRLEGAVKLVLAHDVTVLDDGSIEVGSCSDPLKTYRLEGTPCTCQDFPRAPEGWCRHRIAAGIAKRVGEEWAAQAPQTGSLGIRRDPLPEAPASCNVYVTIGGHKVQVTLRDTDEHHMLERLRVLLAQYPAAPEKPGATPPQTPPPAPVCQWHGPMKPSTKHGGWYCPAKMADGSYCKERQGA